MPAQGHKATIGELRHSTAKHDKRIVDANSTCKDVIAAHLVAKAPPKVRVYRLSMKTGFDNFRDSSYQGIMKRIKVKGIEVVVFEPKLKEGPFFNSLVERDLLKFKAECHVILADHMSGDLADVEDKVFTRDLFGTD